MWRFDLTIVRGAPLSDPTMVDLAVASVEPSHEIEMEFLPEAARKDLPPAYLAHSMLLKAQDICGMLLGLEGEGLRPTLSLPFGAGPEGQQSQIGAAGARNVQTFGTPSGHPTSRSDFRGPPHAGRGRGVFSPRGYRGSQGRGGRGGWGPGRGGMSGQTEQQSYDWYKAHAQKLSNEQEEYDH